MRNPARITSPYGEITVGRTKDGVPLITAENRQGLYFGQGWVQAADRQIQTMLMKAIFTGRMAEMLKADESFVAIDEYMRRYGFALEPEREWDKMSESCRQNLMAHAEGINARLRKHGPVWELRVAGWVPEEWSWKDTLAIGKGFGFIGLGDGQGMLEKWLMQVLCNGTTLAQLKELFPSMCDPDYSELYRKVTLADPVVPETIQWLKAMPTFRASNNWALAPSRSSSGHALMAGDPHLDIDRMPAIWQEMVLSQGDAGFVGVGLPGVPGPIIGRTRNLSWSPTYSCMDSIDFRIEECRDGKYRRGDAWKEFTKRTELLKLKGGGSREVVFLENENGILQGDPGKDGFYLIENYACLRDCGASDLEGVLGLLDAKSVPEGMACFQKLRAASFDWILADSQGNIGMQMSGRHFRRPDGTSGLLPLPAWEERFAYRGYACGEVLPQAFNPPEGFLVTANDDVNRYGTSFPCAINQGAYRRNRIKALVESREKWTARDMGQIQTDLYSLHAEVVLRRFGHVIPDSAAGTVLKDWDKRYDASSKGAVLFDRFYRALVKNTFGKRAWGADVIDYLWDETAVFNVYFHYFDRLLLDGNATWFTREEADTAAREACAEVLSGQSPPLRRTRSIKMGHLLFGGRLPSFLGFDGGPVFAPGGRATVCQAQFFTAAGRPGSFCPSYRFLADMGSEEAWSSLPGGATDRRFSRLYKNELRRYLKGEYKLLTLPPHT